MDTSTWAALALLWYLPVALPWLRSDRRRDLGIKKRDLNKYGNSIQFSKGRLKFSEDYGAYIFTYIQQKRGR